MEACIPGVLRLRVHLLVNCPSPKKHACIDRGYRSENRSIVAFLRLSSCAMNILA